jgi:hypothetical protein
MKLNTLEPAIVPHRRGSFELRTPLQFISIGGLETHRSFFFDFR